MLRSFRWIALGTWLALLVVAFGFAPPSHPETNAMVWKMLRWDVHGVNLSLLGLFDELGLFPLVFMALVAFDTTEQKIWRWPFLLGAFVGGSFIFLPYLVLRRWGAPRRPVDARWLRWLGGRAFAFFCLGGTLWWAGVFFLGGGLAEFGSMFRGDQFAWDMTFDFVAATVAGVLLSIEDQMLRPQSPSWAWSLLSAPGVSLRLWLKPLARP